VLELTKKSLTMMAMKTSLYMSKHIIYERCWCYNVLLHGVLSRTEADALREAEILKRTSD